MTPERIHIDILLNQLEAGLVKHGLYTPDRPPATAFQSTQPFFVDTMSFPVWLQYVLIEKFKLVLQAGGPLPAPCHVAEMAEVYGQAAHFPSELTDLIRQIDDAVNNQGS